MDDDKKSQQPNLQVVSENTETDKARRWAANQVSWALRDLTANLLRVVRGAGKSYEIGRQLEAALQAFIEYQKAFGHWPPAYDLSEALSVDRAEEWRSRLKGSELSRLYAEERVVRGALQKTASRLIGQTTQERAGDSEMYEGFRALEAAQDEMRREWAAQHEAARASAPRRPKRSNKRGETPG